MIVIDRCSFLFKRILNIAVVSKNYELNSVKNLELNLEPSGSIFFGSGKKMVDFWSFTGVKMHFDYGMKTIKFGIGID